ncbi:MAG: hypothetical protein KAW12_25460 [Candidatus Aminicenantes bacterium]|nr:hypothetical protein [Candidatus Aminicenantes bacterium]
MDILKKFKKRSSKQGAESAFLEGTVGEPIEADFDYYESYLTEKKYEDLLSYMKMHPKVEALIFEYFYLHLKPLIGKVFSAADGTLIL